MEQDRQTQRRAAGEQRPILRLIGEAPGQIGVQEHAFHPQALDAALQLGERRLHVLQRQHAQAEETRRMLADDAGDVVVGEAGDGGPFGAEPLRAGIVDAQGRHADGVLIHGRQLGLDVAVIGQHAAIPVAHAHPALAAARFEDGIGLAFRHDREDLGAKQMALTIDANSRRPGRPVPGNSQGRRRRGQSRRADECSAMHVPLLPSKKRPVSSVGFVTVEPSPAKENGTRKRAASPCSRRPQATC